ncbi:MAG: molybdenum ABC transporter ATP-binding protein [Alphaproteobacteria bacterium]|nr:molybdenum ABC transporter ATP-binding protein [Alphaproteobacteria bacterium]MDP6253892.1 molybdenum ABC transporter ATP-binding protein [Alphaproteobacteria bacterium]MDP7056469.1 molybdenum ABC transporter ATP-binding protein [Alphaproteobacteria bacterium]MDP7230424.1 molybdenum ABC transporter ATP-binding protein [Alphaproteobacteria bacterium]MDP7459002.1 molybdenum ABC transporter ATP-binding protein [Alphaproteobacteria bacterium]|tara:strand:- start:5116 stop:6207 length:1092 start_codon:yes stop_codon:yes gene_type:complete
MLDVDLQATLGDFKIKAAFQADAGITALFGPSGAGKTSLVNMLAGLQRPSRGRIVVREHVLFDSGEGIDLPPEQRRLGYVFQESRLFPHLSVADNLSYGYALVPKGVALVDYDAVVDLLALQSLLTRRPGTLSGGERQRVAIGRAILAAPRLLLMDEPLANLDAPRRAEILPFIENLRREFDISIVYVSHNMDEIVRLADQLIVMADGTIAAQGPVDKITARLDLRHLTGRWDAGAVLSTTVAEQDDADKLTRLSFPGGDLWLPQLGLAIGSPLRIRVHARDVSLALTPPEQVSVLNVFAGEVIEVGADDGPQVDVLINIGSPQQSQLWARITKRSQRELNIVPGRKVHAMIKAMAVDRGDMG